MYVRYQVPVARQGPAGRADPRLLPHRQDLGDDARRPHGLGRVLRARGLPTYVIDQAGRGRSAIDPDADERGQDRQGVRGRACRRSSRPATRPRGRSSASGPTIRKSTTACGSRCGAGGVLEADGGRLAATLPTPNPTVPALSQLAIKLGGAVLISHSQSGIYPFQAAALDARASPAIVSIEPGGCPGRRSQALHRTSRRWCCSATMSTCRRAGRHG